MRGVPRACARTLGEPSLPSRTLRPCGSPEPAGSTRAGAPRGQRTEPCPGERDAVMEGGGAGGILPPSAKWSLLPVGGGPAGRAAGRDTPPPPSTSPGPGRLRGPGGRGGAVRAPPLAPRPAGAAAAAPPPAAPPSSRGAGAGARRGDGRTGRAVTANGEWAGIKWSQDDRTAAPPPPLPRARRGVRAGAGRAPPRPRPAAPRGVQRRLWA